MARARLPRRRRRAPPSPTPTPRRVSTLVGAVDPGAIDFDTAVRPDPRGRARRWPGWPTGRSPRSSHRVEQLEAGDEATGSRVGSALRLVEQVGVPFEELLVYVWRRHLAAAVARVEALGANDEDLHTTQVTVGFADIVQLHRAVQPSSTEDRIGDLVEIFESRCADVVAAPARPGDQDARRLGAVRDRGPDPRPMDIARGDHRRDRPRQPDARRPRRAGHRLGGACGSATSSGRRSTWPPGSPASPGATG